MPYALNHLGIGIYLATWFLIWILVEVYMHNQSSATAVRQEAMTEVALGFVTLAAVFWSFQMTFNHPFTGPSPTWLYCLLGLAFLTLGVTLRFLAVKTLGRYFMPALAIDSDHRIITAGPYRYIRHPGYAGAILAFIGLALSLTSTYALLCPLVILPGVILRVVREEQMLRSKFGPAYDEYRRTAGALFPRLKRAARRREPANSQISTS